MIVTGEDQSTRREACPNATFSNSNPKYTSEERPVPNRLNNGTAILYQGNKTKIKHQFPQRMFVVEIKIVLSPQ
jgi:hypothetical protein